MSVHRYFLKSGTWQSQAYGSLGQPTPPPVTGKPAVGYQSRDDWPTLVSDVGNALIRRSFQNDQASPPATWASSDGGKDTNAGGIHVPRSVWSVSAGGETALRSIANGDHDSVWLNFFSSIPNGHKTWLTIWHEPADNITKGSFTWQTWRDVQVHMADLLHSLNRPELKWIIVETLFQWTAAGIKANGDTPTNIWDSRMAGRIDAVGFDLYLRRGEAIGTKMNLGDTWAAQRNLPIILTELGVDDDQTNTAAKANTLQGLYDRGVAKGWIGIIYFDVDGNQQPLPLSDWRMRSSAASTAKYKALITASGS